MEPSTLAPALDVAPPPARARYPVWFAALHWIMAALIVLAWGSGLLLEDAPRGPARLEALGQHAALGFAGLVLLLPRLAFRRHATPADPAETPSLVARAMHLGHFAIYGLLAAALLSGLALEASYRGPMPVGGFFSIPSVAFLQPFHGALEEIHETTSNLLVLLVAAHVALAIWHRFRRDPLGSRMPPFGERRA